MAAAQAQSDAGPSRSEAASERSSSLFSSVRTRTGPAWGRPGQSGRDGGTADSRARRRPSSPARNSSTSWRAASARARVGLIRLHEHAAGCVTTAPPASWVTSWNVRSSARKSGRPSAVSASTTAASATPRKWWPFPTIWVPSRTPRSQAAKPASTSLSVSGRPATSASSRKRSSSGRRAASSVSSFSVPAPKRATSAAPQAGHSSGAGSRRPQWWQCSRPSPCRVRATSQSGQRGVSPHARQWSAGATPRRLRRRMAFPPPSASLPSSSRSGAESG